MSEKLLHRIIGAGVFFISAFVFFFTVQPSVSFWDCGEFVASAYYMQVPHPPGTPFFLLLGRLFAMIPFAENIAFRVNTVSVLASAFTVLLTYLIAVKVILQYKDQKSDSLFESFATFLSAAIGALSLAFASTFWFNAVEAEVYATSTFFIAIVTWLIITWNEKADEPDNEKYIVMIAYLIGLSIGVHLMAVLAIVPIVMIIMFRKYVNDEENLKATAYIFLGHAVVVLLISLGMWYVMTDSTPPSYDLYKEVDQRFIMVALFISLVIMGAFYKRVFARNSFYLPMIFGGIALIATYPGIVKYVPNIISSLGKNNIVLDILILAAIFVLLFWLIYWTNKTDRQTLHLVFKSFLFVLIGFTSYSMIIIRSNQDTPINLNSPKTFSEVVSYLNREQYGDFPTFKRRFTQEGHQQAIYTDYSSDLDFLLRYQMGHMFHRYLLWNYAGKVSTVQDQGVNWGQLWGIPFIIGLFGVFYHFRRDWKMASVFIMMFVFLGYLTAFYQNQQQPQPRERDYFYVGAFFVYSLWIALGTRGIIDLVTEKLKGKSSEKLAASLILVVLFALIPVRMLATNYSENNRSNNHIPWDYAYNMLQSVAPNAVLFTNGDNDTFPLWYLQDVEGVRRDVRIANLSLLNTDWYIKQLKNTSPYNSLAVKMSYDDATISRMRPSEWKAREMTVPVPPEVYAANSISDTTIVNKGAITWRMDPTFNYGQYGAIRVQDMIVLDIIRQNQWERPVYFAVTCSEDSKIGLRDYLMMEGLAYRVMPFKSKSLYESINSEIMRANLFDEPDGYTKDYAPGFKFRGLNDPTVFLDENHERLSQNYRNSFLRLTLYYLYDANEKNKAIATLDKMEEKIPRSHVSIDYRLLYDVANLYYSAGAVDKFIELAADVEVEAQKNINNTSQVVPSDRYQPFAILKDLYEKQGRYDKLVDLLEQLSAVAPNDPSVKMLLNRYRSMLKSDSLELNNGQMSVPEPKSAN